MTKPNDPPIGRTVLLALASAALLALSLPPFGLFLLPFVALVPWLTALRGADVRATVWSGLAFGAAWGAGQMWFLAPLVWRWTGSVALASLPLAIVIVICAGIGVGQGMLLRLCLQNRIWFLAPLAWAGVEAARGLIGPTAFSWGNLAHGLWSVPEVIQHASAGTIFLVSAWCLLPNLILSYAFWPDAGKEPTPHGSSLFRAAFVFCAFLIGSVWRFSQLPEGEVRPVALAQPGIDLAYLRGDERSARVDAATQDVVNRLLRGPGFDVAVLPEGFWSAQGATAVTPGVTKLPFSVLAGSERLHPRGGSPFQSAWGFSAESGEWQSTDKRRLVLFGEYVPEGLRRLLPEGFNLGFLSFRPGGAPRLLTFGPLKVGSLICYEGLFSDSAADFAGLGANLLAVISIDDWYVGTPAYDQLWQASVWRAVETGLPLVRVGGQGQSLAVDARGRLVRMVEFGRVETPVVLLKVPEASDAFPWRMGFVYACWAFCLALPFWVWRRGRGSEA